MSLRKIGIFFSILLILIPVGGCGLMIFALLSRTPNQNWAEGEGNLAILEVKGPIFDSLATNRDLEKLRKNASVKAVVLRVDSPGGGVGASEEIYREVKKLAEKKPVVVSMGSVAASGGYYISAPAQYIFANRSTITGSIGVLMEHVEVDELLKWMKVSAEILKAGSQKDVGSTFRKMSPEERQLLQEVLDNLHHQFQEAVAAGRRIPLEEVQKLATGRVYTGEQAKPLRLIDEFGGLDEAIEKAKVLGKIEGEAKILRAPQDSDSWAQKILGKELLQFLSKTGVFSLVRWQPAYTTSF